jgi:hypothetical protein
MSSIEYCTIAVSVFFWYRIVDILPLIFDSVCLSVRPSLGRTGLSNCAFVCLSILHMCTCVFAGILSLQIAFSILVCLSIPRPDQTRPLSIPLRCRWDGYGNHQGNHQGKKSRTQGKDAISEAASVKAFKLMLFKLMQTMFLMIIDA